MRLGKFGEGDGSAASRIRLFFGVVMLQYRLLAGQCGDEGKESALNQIIRLVQAEPALIIRPRQDRTYTYMPYQHYVLDIDGYKGPEGPFCRPRRGAPSNSAWQYRNSFSLLSLQRIREGR